MTAAAKHQAPDLEAILRAEVAALHDELEEARDALKLERARREAFLDNFRLAIGGLVACVDHANREAERDRAMERELEKERKAAGR